jgi:diguanylate cyclase (GGDEF)-like protein
LTTSTPARVRRALYRALHDPLTGLPNRTVVLERLSNALARAPRRPGGVAVLLVDLDRFKLVNDALGHGAGDALLAEVARRLETTVRSVDFVGRSGGDEFVVVAEDVSAPSEAEPFARRLRDAIALPVALPGGDVVVVTASVGIAFAAVDADAPRAADMLWDAEAAMYQAKERGRDCIEVFEHELRAPSLGRFNSESYLRRAMEADCLRLHFQAIVDLTDGRPIGFEGLVRLEDPERGLVPPGEFLPAAEESGLILPLGEWVTAEAARAAREWATCVFVNLSGRQLAHPGLLAGVCRTLEETGVAPGQLCFELTENALFDGTGPATRNLTALRDLGARLALDDFGTGHASLRWLRQVPVDVLKIDRSFVAGVGEDTRDEAIVAAVVALGRDLGLYTVAEGVETETQRDFVATLGCDWAQGFLFSRPVPAEVSRATFTEVRAW